MFCIKNSYEKLKSPIGWCHRIHRQQNPINECPGYDTKPSHGDAPVLELWGMWSTTSLPLLPESER